MIYAELGARDYTKALLDVASGKTKAWAADSDFLTAKAGKELLYTTKLEDFINGLFAPAGFTDALVSTVAVRGAYNKYIRQGMSHAEAMRKADDFGQKVMGSRAKGSRPLAYESKETIYKMIHMFQVEAVNSWDHIATDIPYEIRKIARTQGKPKAAAALAALILRALMGAFVLNRLTDELYGGTPAPFDILGLTAVEAISQHRQQAATMRIADGRLTMQFCSAPSHPVSVSVYSVAGCRLQQWHLPGGSTDVSVELPRLPGGIYAIQLTSRDSRITGSQLVRIE
jgi:hypothetical protein